MLRFKRPDMPPDFPAAVQATRANIEQKIKELANNPLPASTNKKKKKSLEFPDLWKDYKAHFAHAQHGKCGYCEMRVIGGQDGDVEHFAPKGDVRELDEKSPGEEQPFLSSVKGRKTKVLSSMGYWWMAYDWQNYLLSCAVCNQKWKGAIFPVQEDPRKLPPEQTIEEHPLLLNPFGEIDPGQHLRFSDLGQIEARNQSKYGKETIRTCGLDRDSLVRDRSQFARDAYELVQELSQAIKDKNQAEIRRVMVRFHNLGKAENVHAGMVRIIFEENCGISWSDLGKLVEG